MNVLLSIVLFILFFALIMLVIWFFILNFVWFMLEPIVGKKSKNKESEIIRINLLNRD